MSYYHENAKEYIDATIHSDLSICYDLFLSRVKKGGAILDVGFGSARYMLHFRSLGYRVYGVDNEIEFVNNALSLGLDVTLNDVREYTPSTRFDGIWACASLLHLKKRRTSSDHQSPPLFP